MAKPRVTSVDVARAAGVSQSAVSRAFTPGASVSHKTRDKIFAAARELGYQPNAIARSLITQRSGFVAVAMTEIRNPFYPLVLETFTQKFQEYGRRVLLYTTPPGHDIDEALPQVLEYQVEGIVITSATLSSEMADECARLGTPVVLFNRYVPGAHASSVCCDNVEGGRLVANLLLDAGHRRLAVIEGPENTSTNRDRVRGFTARLEERGVSGVLHERGYYTHEGGYAAAKRLLDRDDPPDALFCINDVMALGALDVARRELNIKVPDEVSIIGFDDIIAAAWPSYDLTTIRTPVRRMVETAVEILMARIDNPALEPEMRLLPGRLVARSSARLPADLPS